MISFYLKVKSHHLKVKSQHRQKQTDYRLNALVLHEKEIELYTASAKLLIKA